MLRIEYSALTIDIMFSGMYKSEWVTGKYESYLWNAVKEEKSGDVEAEKQLFSIAWWGVKRLWYEMRQSKMRKRKWVVLWGSVAEAGKRCAYGVIAKEERDTVWSIQRKEKLNKKCVTWK